MGRRKKSKKRTATTGGGTAPSLPRGCRGNRRRPSSDAGRKAAAAAAPAMVHHDLNVPLPPVPRRAADGRGRRAPSESRRSLVNRLRNTGYGVVAFSHTVYGRPDLDRDRAEIVLSDGAAAAALRGEGGGGAGKKKRKRDGGSRSLASADDDGGDLEGMMATDDGNDDIAILRRLNVVIEELSDLAHYTETSTTTTTTTTTTPTPGGTGTSADRTTTMSNLLDSYDLIALSPRSDATFSSTCSTAHKSDLIMLDYTAGRGSIQLPYKLRTSDIRSATQRGATFELNYAPAILDPAKRKALIRTAVDLRNASLGVREPEPPRIVLSSGSRISSGNDCGPMALRTPGDLINVLRTVLGFDGSSVKAADCLGSAGAFAVKRGRDRRAGRCSSSSTGGGGSVSVFFDGGRDGRWGGVGIRPPVGGSVRTVPAVGGMEESLAVLALEQKRSVKESGVACGDAVAEKECMERVVPTGEKHWTGGGVDRGVGVAVEAKIDREEEKTSAEDGFINLS